MREPTATGGGVCHCTEEMLAYQSGALVGSPAKAATSSSGSGMTASTDTSTSMRRVCAERNHRESAGGSQLGEEAEVVPIDAVADADPLPELEDVEVGKGEGVAG